MNSDGLVVMPNSKFFPFLPIIFFSKDLTFLDLVRLCMSAFDCFTVGFVKNFCKEVSNNSLSLPENILRISLLKNLIMFSLSEIITGKGRLPKNAKYVLSFLVRIFFLF